MSRQIIKEENITAPALQAMENFHAETVSEVAKAVSSNKIVIVGMRQNPVVKRARKLLDEKKQAYTYLEYGSYLSEWKKRLAIKLWSGWPTYPQVFMDGKLVGGCSELEKVISKT